MIVWAMALALAVPAEAAQAAPREESLAEKAARARKAQAAAAPAGGSKVLTNEDLANAKGNVIILSAPPASEAQPAAAAAQTTAAGAPEKPKETAPTEEETRAQAGAALQKQIDEQAESIRKARKTIEAGETELNDITNYTFGARRAAVMQSIEEARQAVAAAQRSIEDLEVQARRQGIRVTLP